MPTSLQPPYSAIRRNIEAEILPYCETHNIGTIVYSPMASGLLAGKMTRERITAFPDDDWRSRSPEFKEPNLTRNLEVAQLLREIGEDHGLTAGAVAVAWTLRLSSVTAAIVGARNPEQVDGVIGAGEFRLSEDELDRIEAKLSEVERAKATTV